LVNESPNTATMNKKCKKGQVGAMGVVVLAISILIGIYLVGAIYSSVDGIGGLPSTVTSAMGDTLDNSTTGLGLMAVGIIVISAMFVLGVMGSR